MLYYEKRGNAQTIQDLIKPGTVETKNKYLFDCKNAPDLIREAIANKTPITIVGDYDCDGICASAIMKMTIEALGGNATVRLPRRFSEGYGMKPEMIDEMDKGLIITVDNGITAFDAVEKAKDLGFTVIVTDHHLPMEELPGADCIIDPHIEEMTGEPNYNYYDYCGAGIALKLAQNMLGKNPIMPKLCGFAAVATVADVMPLTESNRNIYISGTEAMAKHNVTAGLSQLLLMNKQNVDYLPPKYPAHLLLTPTSVMGFKIAPCINAASRMADDGAEKALSCLLCDSNMQAIRLADELVKINEQRKAITEEEQKLIDEHIEKNGVACPIVAYLPDSGQGIIGLHAGSLCEKYKVPVIVINGHGECHGSCRSPEGVNIKELLDQVSDCLINYGGHSGAAGITIAEEKIPEFTLRLQTLCIEQGIEPISTDTLYYDLAIKAAELDKTIDVLNKMAPFGEANPEIRLIIEDAHIRRADVLKGEHIKLTLDGVDKNGNVTETFTGMYFGGAVNGKVPEELVPGKAITVSCAAGVNVYNGRVSNQVIIDNVIDGKEVMIDKNTGSISEDKTIPDDDFER